MMEQAPARTCGPWRKRSPHWSRFAGRTCDPMGDPHRSSLFLKDCTPWEGPHARAAGCLKEVVNTWGARAGASFCQDLWTHEDRSPHWSRFTGRACDPVGDPRWSSLFLKDCTPWKRPALGQLVKNCTPWEGPTLEPQFMRSCGPWKGLTLEKFVENCLP